MQIPQFQFRLRWSMALVAAFALYFAYYPAIHMDPVAYLAVAALVVAILAVAARGRSRTLRRWAIALVLLTCVAMLGREARSIWSRAAKLRGIAAHCGDLEVMARGVIRDYDANPTKHRSPLGWSAERSSWIKFADHAAGRRAEFERRSLRPWLSESTDPPHWLRPPRQ